jgi:hypothetical protein
MVCFYPFLEDSKGNYFGFRNFYFGFNVEKKADELINFDFGVWIFDSEFVRAGVDQDFDWKSKQTPDF